MKRAVETLFEQLLEAKKLGLIESTSVYEVGYEPHPLFMINVILLPTPNNHVTAHQLAVYIKEKFSKQIDSATCCCVEYKLYLIIVTKFNPSSMVAEESTQLG
jgi:hypothetical protein